MIGLYEYAISIIQIAHKQGKPEWALSEKEKRALRHLKAFNNNFEPIGEEQPIEQ
jgi:hypothetical protein